jgi:hypothetical protein
VFGCILFGGEFRGVGNFFLLSEFQRERDREICFVLFSCLFVCLFVVLKLSVGASLCSFVGVQKLSAEGLALFSAFLGFSGLTRSF